MKKNFFKYCIFVIVITYSSILINNTFNNMKGITHKKVSATVTNIDKEYKEPTLVNKGQFLNLSFNRDGSKIIYNENDNIYEMNIATKEKKQLTFLVNSYQPIYTKDESEIVFARNDGIYMLERKSGVIKQIIGSKDKGVVFSKPNFTKEGDLIYFKSIVLPSSTGHGFTEESPSIYKVDKNGTNNVKIIDGYNPVVSPDGLKLVYTLNYKIYMLDLKTKENKLIDDGIYPSFSQDGNYISYTKYEIETVPYTKLQSQKNLFIDKNFTSICIVKANNLESKYKITKEEILYDEKEVDKWATMNKNTDIEKHFYLGSKYTYYDTGWYPNNKNIYIVRNDNTQSSFELVKLEIDLK